MYRELIRLEEWWMNIVVALVASFVAGITNPYLFLPVIAATAFIWAFGFAINDIYDAPFDMNNKKTRNPVARGMITKSRALAVCSVLALAGIAPLVFLPAVSTVFFISLLAAFYVYSAEPFRFKERYPSDIIFHGAFGPITFLAGYTAAGRIDAFAAAIAAAIMFFSIMAEILQEMRDYDIDRASGFQTAAIRLGLKKSELALKLMFISALAVSAFALYFYLPGFLIALLSFAPFAKFLFLDRTKGNYFSRAMKAARNSEILFIVLFVIAALL